METQRPAAQAKVQAEGLPKHSSKKTAEGLFKTRTAIQKPDRATTVCALQGESTLISSLATTSEAPAQTAATHLTGQRFRTTEAPHCKVGYCLRSRRGMAKSRSPAARDDAEAGELTPSIHHELCMKLMPKPTCPCMHTYALRRRLTPPAANRAASGNRSQLRPQSGMSCNAATVYDALSACPPCHRQIANKRAASRSNRLRD